MEVPYSRLLNRPVRYFRFFAMIDLFIIVAGVIVVPQVLGFWGFFALFVLFFLHLAIFRINRRPGYDVHFFKALLRPTRFRAGRAERRAFIKRSHDAIPRQ